MLFTESKFDIIWLPLNAKRAAIFGGRLLKTGISIPRWSGHLTGVMIDARLCAFEAAPKLE